MKTMKMQFVEALNAPDAPLPLRMAHAIWEHLPLLLGADLLLCMAFVPPALAWLAGGQLVAPWIAALTLGPAWAATSAIADTLVRGETASWRDLLAAGKRHWLAGVSVSCVPALITTLWLGTWDILAANPHMTWLYLPLFVDGCLAMLVLLASLSAFSLRVGRGLHGLTLWKVALSVTTLRIGRTLGILVLFLCLALLLLCFNVGLLPVLGAPLAVCLAALTNHTCESLLQREIRI